MAFRVLVADDSAVVRMALVRRFKAAGLDVVEAASVAEAKRIDPTGIDVAVLDFDLGDGYGNEIAAHLKAGKADLPMCFFTSSSAEARVAVEGYGQIFKKPDDSDAVIAWVTSVTGLAG